MSTTSSDYEEVGLTTDIKISMEQSDFAQVIFHNVAEVYQTDTPIQCHYTITPSLQPSTKDWVGIYRVGWGSSNEYVHFQWAPHPDNYQPGTEVDCSISIQAKYLPKEDGEFYQFCYVARSGQVRGSSTPFQFRQQRSDDFVEVEDEDHDVLIIKSKSVALEDDLKKANKEKEELIKNKSLLETERDSLLRKLLEYSKKLQTLADSSEELKKQAQEQEDKMTTLTDELQEKDAQLQSLQEDHVRLNEELASLNGKLLGLQETLEQKDAEIKSLTNEKDALLGKCRLLEEEKEMIKTHCSTSEDRLQGYMQEVDKLQKEVYNQEQSTRTQTTEVSRLTQALAQESEKATSLLEAKEADKQTIEHLTIKLKDTEDQLSTVTGCMEMSKEEASAVKQAHDKMAQLLEQAKTESHTLKVQCGRLETKQKTMETEYEKETKSLKDALNEKAKEKEDIASMLAEVESKLRSETEKQQTSAKEKESDTVALYHMRIAQTYLNERYARLQKDYEEAKRKLEHSLERQAAWNEAEAEMKREIEDLKERLQMGAEEYKTKYIECRKLSFEVKKLTRQVSQVKVQQNGAAVVEKAEIQASGALDKSEAESQTSIVFVDESEVADLTNTELQSQLDALGQELEQRHAKKQKYKHMYHEERDKNNLLHKHYYEELQQKQDEIDRLNGMLEDTRSHVASQVQATLAEDYRQKVQELQALIAEQKKEISGLRRPVVLPQLQEVRYPPQGTAFPSIPYPQQVVPPVAPTAPTDPSGKHVIQYPDAQEDQAGTLQARGASTGTGTERRGQEPEGACGGDLSQTGKANQAASVSGSVLPPPILPEVLPSARLAAIRAACPSLAGQASQTSPAGAVVAEPGLTAAPDVIPAAPSEPETPPQDVPDSHPRPEPHGPDSLEVEEERFMDADGDPQKICPVCATAFPADLTQTQFELHIDSHYGRSCPICSEYFSNDINQTPAFEDHVQQHFAHE